MKPLAQLLIDYLNQYVVCQIELTILRLELPNAENVMEGIIPCSMSCGTPMAE